MPSTLIRCAALTLLLGSSGALLAQGPRSTEPAAPTSPRPRVQVLPPTAGRGDPKADGLKTIVEVDIIIPSVGAGAEVQEWGRFFQSLGISAQLRQGNIDEKPSTTDSVRGTLRTVQVVGRLDPRGRVIFADRTYTAADKEKAKEWLEELKVYGAQGTPEGKPSWGLNRDQFEALFEAMSVPTENGYEGLTLKELLMAADWRTPYPIRLHTTTETVLAALPAEPKMRISPTGLSRGTALACLLEDAGLGFRPQRTPAGGVELIVYPLSAIKDPWPMGWPLEPSKPRNEIAPGYFKSGAVDFEQQPLTAVLEAIAERAGLPILLDHPRCEAKKIDPAEAKVSHPKKTLAYALVVNTVVHQVRLTASLKLDEAGKPFVQIAPFDPRAAVAP